MWGGLEVRGQGGDWNAVIPFTSDGLACGERRDQLFSFSVCCLYFDPLFRSMRKDCSY